MMHIVLVHGWSVFDTSTYGELPDRLVVESKARRLPDATVQSVWLGRYVSFKDEVRMPDLALGFQAAFEREVLPNLEEGTRFACITHSTGGPVIRHWWWRFYHDLNKPCPMSHLVMLAPANFGSALAQLGKGRLSRLRSWQNGVEPGQGVLDWLEHGSDEAWDLNRDWIVGSNASSPTTGPTAVFPFVLTGQTIDRRFYDHLNPYTGEDGSDGTVRVAAANLNASYIRLEQQVTPADVHDCDQILDELRQGGRHPDLDAGPFKETLAVTEAKSAAPTAFRLIKGASHTGDSNGIMFSIKNDDKKNETVSAIVRCLRVKNDEEYASLCAAFEKETAAVYAAERIEKVPRALGLRHTKLIHDAHAVVQIRVRDDAGHVLTDFDLKLTGPKGTPDDLPEGFLKDRQKNLVNKSTLTFFLNVELLYGSEAVDDVRPRTKGVNKLGLRLYGYPVDGFVRFFPAIASADKSLLQHVVQPHRATLLDIRLRRIVCRGIFELQTLKDQPQPFDFRNQSPGTPIS
jgi:hypothetical protein